MFCKYCVFHDTEQQYDLLLVLCAPESSRALLWGSFRGEACGEMWTTAFVSDPETAFSFVTFASFSVSLMKVILQFYEKMSRTGEVGKFDCTSEKDLKCQALGTVVVTPQNSGSMINRNIVTQFAESVELDTDVKDAKRPVYLVWAARNDVLWWTAHRSTHGWPELREVSIPDGVCELCDGCFEW